MKYTIANLSKTLKIPISTIRYWEKIGIIPHPMRTNNNYRYYNEEQKRFIYEVYLWKEAGLSLKDIKLAQLLVKKKEFSKVISILNRVENNLNLKEDKIFATRKLLIKKINYYKNKGD